MKLATLPLDELDCFSDGLARTRGGWFVSIEEHHPDLLQGKIGIDEPVHARPFRRLARYPERIVVEYEEGAGERGCYTIPHPLGLRQVLREDPTIELRVEDDQGNTTRIHLQHHR